MDGVAFISAKFAQYGLTTVHHNEDGALEAIQEQRLRGNLKHRVSYEVAGELLEAMIKQGIESNFGDEWVRLGATADVQRPATRYTTPAVDVETDETSVRLSLCAVLGLRHDECAGRKKPGRLREKAVIGA